MFKCHCGRLMHIILHCQSLSYGSAAPSHHFMDSKFLWLRHILTVRFYRIFFGLNYLGQLQTQSFSSLGFKQNQNKMKREATKLRLPKLLKMQDANHLGCLKSVWLSSSANCVLVDNVMLLCQHYGSQKSYLLFNILHTECQPIFKLLK